jgi:hypothetical protein
MPQISAAGSRATIQWLPNNHRRQLLLISRLIIILIHTSNRTATSWPTSSAGQPLSNTKRWPKPISTVIRSGYYHGAVEQIAQEIGPAKIVADMPSVCASFFKTKPYGFDHYNCVHGMGHGLMVVENDNLFKSLDLCDTYTDSWEQSSCYSGVFMENVMDSILPGHHTNYIKADDPLYPCTAVKQRYEADCYMMQTSHALVVENEDYSKVFSLCSTVQSPYDIDCYQSLGRDVSGNSSSDQATSIQLCMEGPTSVAQDNCFTGAVKDFISYYHSDTQGLALCAAIPDSTLSVSCTSTAHTYYQSF